MVLKHVGNAAKKIIFRGSSQIFNKQYNIIYNPYNKTDTPVSCKNLSIISR